MGKLHQVRDIHAVKVCGSRTRLIQLGKLILSTAHIPSQDLVQQVRRGSHYSAPISSDRRFFPTFLQSSDIGFPNDLHV
jgi:hypothetical protein